MDPKVITIDEPDTSLDPRTRRKLVNLLGSLPQVLVVATCNMNFAAQLCDRAVLMDKGKIIVDGTVEEIMTDEKLMLGHGLEVATDLKNSPGH